MAAAIDALSQFARVVYKHTSSRDALDTAADEATSRELLEPFCDALAVPVGHHLLYPIRISGPDHVE